MSVQTCRAFLSRGFIMPRQVDTGTYLSNEEIKVYTLKENEKRKRIYKQAIGHCCMPDCRIEWNLQVHHIYLIFQGGTDDFSNYIVLCGKCHKTRRVHRFSLKRKIEISVYKFYIERMELGFCSDEITNEEFELKLRKLVAERKAMASG